MRGSKNMGGDKLSNLLAIDPGTTLSAYVLMDSDYKPIEFAKIPNEDLLLRIKALDASVVPQAAVEMVASYGMAVGQEVFETCVWVGRYMETLTSKGIKTDRVYRKEVKMCLCGQTRAKDANIRAALLDRFGDVGTKARQGWFYGFKADVWAAYAVGVAWMDKQKEMSA